MPGLFDGTPLERPVTCAVCEKVLAECACPRNAAGKVVRPQDQRIHVRRERRRGKVVTVAAGFDPVASDLPALLKELRKALAAGGTVSDDAIELQGEHEERVRAFLKERGYG